MAGSSAPFHLLASEGAVYTDKDHVWHMDTLAACAMNRYSSQRHTGKD